MKTSRSLPSPAPFVFAYVGLLAGAIAALVARPFNAPLLCVLILLVAASSLFAAAVFSLMFVLIAGSVCGQLADCLGGGVGKKPDRRRLRPTSEDAGLWDRWIDGT